MKYLFLIIFISFLSACDKSDPNPELSDEVYKDYVQELDISSKALEEEEKSLLSLVDEKQRAIPQTGQIKYVQKKVYDSERKIDALKQQKQFFEIKLEFRKHEVRQRYLESRRGGRKWPDPHEIDVYRSTIKLQREKLTWDKNKGMKKAVPRGTPSEKAEPEAAPSH